MRPEICHGKSLEGISAACQDTNMQDASLRRMVCRPYITMGTDCKRCWREKKFHISSVASGPSGVL